MLILYTFIYYLTLPKKKCVYYLNILSNKIIIKITNSGYMLVMYAHKLNKEGLHNIHIL